MIKLIATLHRKPGMSREDFLRHWREVHVPLVAALPHLKGYVINTSVEFMADAHPFDGVAELWYEDRESLEKSLASPQRNASRADLAAFTDVGKLTISIVDEQRIR